jgi:general secretion pathway protein E
VLEVAVAYPLDIKTMDEVRTQVGSDIEVFLASASEIADGLKQYYGLAADTLERIHSESGAPGEPPAPSSFEKVEDIEKLAGDASVIKLVNQIILDAYRKRATDIHIEPFREGMALRYRIDGVLYDANVATDISRYMNAIISRIKIMSNLNIVERRLPQDGRAIVRVQEQMLDLRISTIPTPFGESVVIRILPTHMLFSLEKLGLSSGDLRIFEDLIRKPHGIVFVTGPTGSGKTTTLYAALSCINTKDRKIITIEDPIEYEMAGITQIQVQPEIGLDFARGLRSILRHDPDVIMVGEVRDLETAEIAIRVALTGHLVFSTLHTNDAASGVTRLLDIGVEPYLLASSVEAFIAQRLIRTICPDCKYEDKSIPQELRELIRQELGLDSISAVKVYRGRGCTACNFTGFFGRTAIYEVMRIEDSVRGLILKKAPADQIKKAAVAAGMHLLRQDGWEKVLQGVTTPEEVFKVAPSGSGQPGAQMLSSDSAIISELQDNRRVFPRLYCEATLRYNRFDPSGSKGGAAREEEFSRTTNISAGGILFVSQEQLSIGTLLELSIVLPDGQEPVVCLSRVVRVENAGQEGFYNIAVCFLDITSGQRARLSKYVDGHLQGP